MIHTGDTIVLPKQSAETPVVPYPQGQKVDVPVRSNETLVPE